MYSLSEIVNVDKTKCVNCHACISACPVKYCNDGSGDVVSLNSDMCIGCGKCITNCTHKARNFIDDYDKFITALTNGDKIIALSTPSVVVGFPEQYLNLNGWLKKMGVDAIFDVSFGAELSVKSYVEHLKDKKHRTVITQPCAAIVTYIELYKPELLKYLAPVDSPILHTIKMLKDFYPQYKNHKIAIISPCNAKKREFEATQLGDYNVGQISIANFLQENKVDLNNYPAVDFDNPPAERAVMFSSPGGLLKTLKRWIPEIEDNSRKIEGISLVYEYFESLSGMIEKSMSPHLIDCLNCDFGCNSGPLSVSKNKPQDEIEYWIRKRAIEQQKKYLDQNDNNQERANEKIEEVINQFWKPNLYQRSYVNRSENINIVYPTNEELINIYFKLHKYTENDIKNCTSCGYNSCEGMAIAIKNKLNKVENCHYYLKNEGIIAVENVEKSNFKFATIIDTAIDGFIEVNTELFFLDVNPSMKKKLKANNLIGRSLYEFVDEPNKAIVDSELEKRMQGIKNSYELEFTQSDGNKIFCHVSATPKYDFTTQKIIGSYAMVSDISKIKEAEKELIKVNENLEYEVRERTNKLLEAFDEIQQRNEVMRQHHYEILSQKDALADSEKRTKYILSSIPDAVFIIDSAGKVTFWNDEMEKMTGIKSEQIIGKNYYEYSIPFFGKKKPMLLFLVNRKDEYLTKNFENIRKKANVLQTETNISDFKRKTKYFIEIATAIFDKNNNYDGAIEVIHDITERKEQEKLILTQNEDITDSIEYAKKIQVALLRSEKVFNKDEIFVFFRPKNIVSGDFYLIKEVFNYTIIVAADSTGHGVPGAFMSLLGVSLLNEIITRNYRKTQGKEFVASKILDDLRTNIIKTLHQEHTFDSNKDGIDIALCIINNNKHEMQYAGAYNPLILFRENKIIEIKADKMPIGIYVLLEKPKKFTNNILQLQNNDTFYIFSDGYQDQFSEKNGRKFMKGNFKKLLFQIHNEPLIVQKQILRDRLNSYKGNIQQTDDIVVIGVKYNI